jgi:hypothetical protein
MISNVLNAKKEILLGRDIKLNYYRISVLNISVYHLFTRVYAQTHVFKISINKGFQWVLYNATEATGISRVGVVRVIC